MGTVTKGNGSDGFAGRDERGRFAQGWRGGPGNIHAKKTAALRKAMYAAVSPKDLRIVVKKLLEQAQAGDTSSTKLLLSYVVGEPMPYDFTERLASLEHLLEAQSDG